MKPIKPEKRRLAIALAVAVKNYARLQRYADKRSVYAEYYNILGIRDHHSEYKEINALRAAACDTIWNASVTFALRKEREGAFPQLGDGNLWASGRFSLAKRRFRFAAIKIAKRGNFWHYDEASEKLEKWSQ
jgi:hypothetical protein